MRFCIQSSRNRTSDESMPMPNSARRLRFFVTNAGAERAAFVGCSDGATTGAAPPVSAVVAGGRLTGGVAAGAGATSVPDVLPPAVVAGGGACVVTAPAETEIWSAVTGWNDASNVG